ncbi:MAG TPA: globin family protein [Anaerolineae bacterium]|nr:globin family protein [Anaerolineae bacterium]
MTPEQIALVQTSFKKVIPITNETADTFYGRLFEVAPGVRPLFSDDMAEQKHKLMQTLSMVVTSLHHPEAIVPTVQDLGRRHVEYGAEVPHYDVVGGALIWTLQQKFGDEFTPELEEAWVAAYTLLATVMTEAAAEVE